MQWTQFTEQVGSQLTAAAALGDERTREIAANLAITVQSAVRMAVLDSLAAASLEITAALHDVSGDQASPAISVHLDGDEVRFAVTVAPVEAAEPAASRPEDGELSARISLRLPETLKLDIERAAGRADLSVNSWLVRAAAGALSTRAETDRTGWNPAADGKRVTGWITG